MELSHPHEEFGIFPKAIIKGIHLIICTSTNIYPFLPIAFSMFRLNPRNLIFNINLKNLMPTKRTPI
jgi:hypothetical protein